MSEKRYETITVLRYVDLDNNEKTVLIREYGTVQIELPILKR